MPFLVLGVSTFRGLPHRDQQLAVALSDLGCEVDFIEIPVSVASCVHGLHLRMFDRLAIERTGVAEEAHGVRLHRPPLVLTGFRRSYSRPVDRAVFRHWFRRRFAGRKFSDTVVYSMLPSWLDGFVTREWLRPAALGYDIFDDLDTISPTRRSRAHLETAERRMPRDLDFITCSAHQLEVDARRRFPGVPVHVLPNAVSDAFIAMASEPGSAANGEGAVGFLGTLEPRWFDTELVAAIAANMHGTRFHLIGPVPSEVRSALHPLENVTLHGTKSPRDALRILRACRVGIIPFRKNHLTDVVNPLKLYEYTAAGLRVVATDTGELRRYSARATLVSTLREWIDALHASLEAGTGRDSDAEMFLHENTWHRRALRLLELVSAGRGNG